MKRAVLLILVFANFNFSTQAQDSAAKKNSDTELFCVFAGYGIFPIEKVALQFPDDARQNEEDGPFYLRIMADLDGLELGFGLSYQTFSYDEINSTTLQPVNNRYRSLNLLIRVNLTKTLKKEFQVYLGGGYGSRTDFISHGGGEFKIQQPDDKHAYELTAGLRYYLNKHIGFYFEGGYAKSELQVGLFFRK